MDQIIINNTDQVKSDAEELITTTAKIDSVKESIEYILDELNAYWEATQTDQQAFYSGLKADAEALTTIDECNIEFANAMIEYMDVTKDVSSQTV